MFAKCVARVYQRLRRSATITRKVRPTSQLKSLRWASAIAALAAAVLGLTAEGASAQPNLITNGDFSANAALYQGWPGYDGGSNPAAPTGWTIVSGSFGLNGKDTAASVFYDNIYQSGNTWTSTSGRTVRDFLLCQGPGAVQQAVTTTSGHAYGVTFDASTRAGGGGFSPGEWSVTVGTATFTTPSITTADQWYGEGFSFVSAGGSSNLTFNGTQNQQNLANVSLNDISDVWNGGTSGTLGGPDANFGATNLNFATASSYANGILSFNDNDGAGGAVLNATLTTVVGGVSAGTLQFNNAAINYTLNSSDAIGITGATALVKNGAGTLTLGGVNTYNGGTAVNAGVLSVTNAGALGSGSVSVNGGQLYVNELSGTIANNLTLNGTTANGPVGSGALVFHNDGQTATLAGSVTLAGNVKIRGYSAGGTTIFSNPIGGTGNLTLEAGGAIPQHTQYWVLQGAASTFSGNVLVRSDGTANSYLKLDGGTLPSGSVLTLEDGSTVGGNNAVLDLNGNNQTLAGLNRIADPGGLGSFVTNSGASLSTLTINASVNNTFSGVIGANTAAAATGQSSGSDNIALIKSGTGTLTLSGVNTYLGDTTLNGGKLYVTGGLLSSGNVTVASAATLGGTGSVGNVTVAHGGILEPGVAGLGTLTANSLTFGANTGNTATINLLTPSNYLSTPALQVNGNVSALGGSGTVMVNFPGIPASGTYRLLSYGGTLNDPTAFTTVPLGHTSVIMENNPQELDMAVSVAYPIWSGATSNAWLGGNNWTLNTDGSTTDFLPGDMVLFDDTATGSTTVDILAGNVSPMTTTFNNSALNYTLQSSGGYGIVSGSLLKSGTGLLTITSNNSYAGGSTISGGTVQIGNGGASGNLGSGAISNSATLVFNRSDNYTLGNAINGSGSLTQAGPGVLILAGSNTYTGTTTISGGTLQIDNGGTTGALGTGAVANNASLVFNSANNITVGSGIGGSGSLTQAGPGQLTLTGSLPYTGPTLVSGGTLTLQNPGGFVSNLTVNSTLNIVENGTWAVPGITFSGSGTLVVSGGGLLRMGGTGGTNIAMTGGLINIQSGGIGNTNHIANWTNNKASLNVAAGDYIDLQGNDIYVDAVTGAGLLTNFYGEPHAYFIGVNNGSGTFSGNISSGNPITVVKQGSGTQVLSGTGNSWNNGTQVNAGVLQLGPGASLGNATATGAYITASGGTLDLGGNSQAVAAAVTFAGGTVQDGTIVKAGADYAAQSGIVSANLAGSVGLTKTTTGTLTLSGTNAYAGNTTLNAGIVQFNSANAIGGSGASVTIAAGATAAAGYPMDMGFLGRINPSSAGAIAMTTSSSAALDFSNDSGGVNLPSTTLGVIGTQTYTGTITPANNTYLLGGGGGTLVLPNDQALTDAGVTPQSLVVNGNLTLAGNNNYSGGTTLSSGTLQLAKSGAAQNSTVTGMVGTVLTFGPNVGAFTVGGLAGSQNVNLTDTNSQPVTLSVGGNNQSTSYAGTLSGAGGLVKAGSGTLALSQNQTYSGPTVVSGGTLLLNGSGGAPSGILAHYSFDGTLNDSTGNNNGAFVGGTPTYVSGKFGQALSLNGTSQYVAVADAADLNGLNSWTVSAWVDLSSTPNAANGVLGTRIGGENTFDIKVQTGSPSLHSDIGSGTGWLNTSADADPSIPTGTWCMVTETVTGAGYVLYANGVQVGTGGVGTAPLFMKSGETLGIGNDYGPGEYLKGSIDDVYVYGRALSGTEVAKLYAGAGNPVLPTTTALQIGGGATVDLYGTSQTVASLSDSTAPGGTLTNSGTSDATLTVGDATTTLFSGSIVDGPTNKVLLTKVGAGMLTLAGNNTYSGPTTITAGTLSIGNGGTSGSLGGGAVLNNSSLLFSRSDILAVANAISGNGSLTQAGPGTTILTGANTYTGSTTVAAGTLQFGDGTGIASVPGNIVNNSNVIFNTGLAQTYTGTISTTSGTGNFTKTGAGVLSLTATQTYSGATAIAGGTLKLAGAAGAGLTIQSFTSDADSGIGTSYGATGYTEALAFEHSGNNLVINGVTFANASQSGTNYTTSNWTSNYPSGSFSGAGTQTNLLLSNFIYGNGQNPQTLTISGLTPGQTYDARIYYRDFESPNPGTRLANWTFDPGTGTPTTMNNVNEDANLTGNYLDFTYMAGPAGTLVMSASDQNTGATWHLYGFTNQLIPNGSNLLPTSTALSIAANSTLDLGGGNQQVASLADYSPGSGGSVTNSGGGAVTLSVSGNASTTFSGVLSDGTGGLALTKNGTGTLTLAGIDTYSGVTSIVGGKLNVNGSLASATVTVSSGAALGGTGTIAGPVAVANGAAIDLIDGTVGTLTLTNPGTALSLGSGAGSAVLDFEIGANSTDQLALTAGSLDLNGAVTINLTQLGATQLSAGTYNLVSFSGGTAGSGNFVLGSIGELPTALVSLNTTANDEQLIIQPGMPATAYWSGAAGATWSNKANWSTDSAGSNGVLSLPGSISDVYFTATSGTNLTTTLDTDFTVKSLNFTATSASVTINGSNTLTIATAAGVNDPAGAAAQVINANVALGAAQTWTVNSASPLNVGGVISGASTATLTLAGSGAVVLTASNTYTGVTMINSGVLQLGNGTSNGSVSGDIVNNASLVFANATTECYAGAITGSGGVTLNGRGALTLSGVNGYSGGTTINGGATLSAQGGGVLGGGGLVLAGSLNLGCSNAAASLSLIGGTLTGNGTTLTVSAAIDAEGGAVSANLAGNAALNKTTGGTVLLSGNNNYNGGTSISAGVVQLGSAAALPHGGALTINAGTLDLAGNSPTVGALAGASGTVTSSGAGVTATLTAGSGDGSSAFNGVIADGAGQVALIKAGGGTLTLNAANNYSGGTTVAGGTLKLGNATALGTPSAALTVNAGTLDLAGNSPTVGALQSTLATGVVASSTGPATLTAGAGDATSNFGGVIVDGVGPVALVKIGGGTLALGGVNAYSGGTTISGGALSITSSANLGRGNVTIGAGALQTSGNVVLDAARTVTLTNAASAIDTPQPSDTTTLNGPVIGTGALNKEGTGILTLAAPSGDVYTGDTNVSAGILDVAADNALSPTSNLVIGDGASVILDFGGGSGISGDSFLSGKPSLAAPTLAAPALATPALSPADISTVPEPGTLLLLVAGALAGLIAWRRKAR